MTRRARPTSYPQSIRELYALQSFGIKLGLRNIRGLLRSIGDPHRRIRVIHIAGTNGKGSTAALIAAVLTEAGYRTGLYTSPHLVDFRERMRIDGREISSERVVAWTRRLLPEVWRRRSTFFEAVTAMAFGWFEEEGVDVAVIETGLGGRLDATNVVTPILSVITSIGLEHTAHLGPTISHIAAEKAGIIKPGVPCVLGVRAGTASKVIRRRARSVGANVVDATQFSVRLHEASVEGSRVSLPDATRGRRDVMVGLPGSFQVQNVSTAVASIETLRQQGLPVSEGSIERGFRDVARLTGFRGRLTCVRAHPRVIIDVAHNPPAMRSLASALRALRILPTRTVLGIASDKALASVVKAIGPVTGRVVAVAARTSRARPADDIARACQKAGLPVETSRSVAEGIRKAVRTAGRRGTVLITGSHFVVGEALAYLERRRYLTITQ